MNTTIKNIKNWAIERNLHTADPKAQLSKLMEESGELAAAINKDRGEEDIADAIGDCVVVLTILGMQTGVDIEQSVRAAYKEIKDRKGMMIGGVFVKDGDESLEYAEAKRRQEMLQWEEVVSSSQWRIGMDREIKFRVWDKNRKIMFDVYGIDPNHVIPWARSGPGIPPDREDVVLMQYTGLKDRSGKEIYEGDIVKAHFNKNPLPVRWHTRQAAWFVGGGHRLSMFHEEGVEVVGNIYKNPGISGGEGWI